jgi:hypothetical protein
MVWSKNKLALLHTVLVKKVAFISPFTQATVKSVI